MKKLDLYLATGIFCNLLLVVIFVYVYFDSAPLSSELTDYSQNGAKSLSIYNDKLDQAVNKLRKTEGLPINVDPNEIGKDNPYNF